MTIFFDTNVLLYLAVNQDLVKQKMADNLVLKAIQTNSFLASPLVISELIFVLSKLKALENNQKNIDLFSSYAFNAIDVGIVQKSYSLCAQLNCCKNINDVINLKFAEKYANKLVTFDSDFEKLKPYTKLEIEILKI